MKHKYIRIVESNVTPKNVRNLWLKVGGTKVPSLKAFVEGEYQDINPVSPPDYPHVDLGLPSGTLWAKCNLGAQTETDYGLYFQWGDTQGYVDATSKTFDFANYKYSDGGSTADNMTKYNSTDELDGA